MAALLPLLALVAQGPAELALDPAPAADLVRAVQSCSRVVSGKTKVDHAALEADGWKQDQAEGVWIVRRKAGNAAIILANNGQSSSFPGNLMQEVCTVRARLADAASLAAAADQMTGLAGVAPFVSKRRQDKRFWRGASVWIGQETVDPAAEGPPITQFAVMPALQPGQRPTTDASSQNKNQELR